MSANTSQFNRLESEHHASALASKRGHVISQKTSFEKHQETVISALLLGTEVTSRVPRTVLATSLNQHPLQTENVAKKKSMPQMKKRGMT